MKKIAILLFFITSFSACSQGEKNYSGPVEDLTVAISALEASTLIRVAEYQGFFEEQGLDITFIEDELGKFSLQRLLDGEADIATAAEFPFVKQSFERDDLRLFGTIHTSNKNVRLLVAKGSGVQEISALAGHTLAVTKGTVGEFFLELILLAHDVDPDEVIIQDLTPDEINQALEMGTIDGFALREPHVYRAEQEFGDSAVVFPVDPIDEVYTATFNLMTTEALLESKNEAFQRFLVALVKAEDFILSHPEETQSIIAEDLDLEMSYLEETWGDSAFSLQLTQALLVGMEDEARWRIEKGLTEATEIPDILSLIETELLKEVKPESMQIIQTN